MISSDNDDCPLTSSGSLSTTNSSAPVRPSSVTNTQSAVKSSATANNDKDNDSDSTSSSSSSDSSDSDSDAENVTVLTGTNGIIFIIFLKYKQHYLLFCFIHISF